MGVVRQEVKTSAGNSALCGRVSCASQEASRIQSLGDPELEPPQSWSWAKKEQKKKNQTLYLGSRLLE